MVEDQLDLPIPTIGKGSDDDWHPTPEEKAAYEIIKGTPFPKDWQRTDVMKARIALRLTQREWENNQKPNRRHK